VGTADAVKKSDGPMLEFIPFIQTSEETMMIDRDLMRSQQDSNSLLKSFVSEGKVHTLTARINGHISSAFPEGLEVDEDTEGEENGDEQPGSTVEHIKESDINVIVVTDTDILSDRLWIKIQSFLA